MPETAWAPPEGYVEWKPPEGYAAVDTLPQQEQAALQGDLAQYQKVRDLTARTSVPQSPDWWEARRTEAVLADADPLSRAPAIISEPYRAVAGASASIASTVTRPFSKETADYFAAAGKQIEQEGEAARKDDWSPWASKMYGGAVGSLAQAAAASPAGPYGIIASFALTEGNQALYDAEQAGLTGNDRLKYAAIQGAIEGTIATAFNRIGLPGGEKFISQVIGGAMKTSGKQFVKATAQEIPEELLTEVGHAVAEQAYGIDPNAADVTSPEFWQRMGETVVQTIGTLGLAHGAAKITQNRQQIEQLEEIRSAEPQEIKRRAAEVGITGSRKEVREQLKTRVDDLKKQTEQLEQETAPPVPQEPSNASPVPSPEAEVRKEPSGQNVRRQGEVEVPAQPAGEGVTAPEVPVAPPKEIDLTGMGSGIVDNFYDGILKSLMERGEVPSAERNSSIGRAWNRVRDTMATDEFVDRLRKEGPDAIGVVRNVPAPAEDVQPPPVDEARVRQLLEQRGKVGNKVSEEIAREDVAKEAEMLRQYPPGTILKIPSFNRNQEFLVGDDGILREVFGDQVGRSLGKAPGEGLRPYKPEQITVVSPPQAPTPPQKPSEAIPTPEVVPQPETLPEASQEPEAAKKNMGLKDQGRPEVMLGSGETATTSSGRQTSPFPKVGTGSDRKAQNAINRVHQWLIDNAVAEAESRGDDWNASIFRSEKATNLPPASKDAMNEYLFGQQPDVPKKLTGLREPPRETDTYRKVTPEPASEPSKASQTTEGNRYVSESVTMGNLEAAPAKPKRGRKSAKKQVSGEERIVHETENLYGYLLDNGRIAIRMHNGTHSLSVGEQPDLDTAKKTMERLERHPEQLREFMGAYPAPKTSKPVRKPKSTRSVEFSKPRTIGGRKTVTATVDGLQDQAGLPLTIDIVQPRKGVNKYNIVSSHYDTPEGQKFPSQQEEMHGWGFSMSEAKRYVQQLADNATGTDELGRMTFADTPQAASEQIAKNEAAAEKAQREAEEARPELTGMGFGLGGGPSKGERVRTDEIPDAMKAPDAQEARLEAAHGYRTPSMLQRVRETLGHLRGVFRAQEHLPATEEFASDNEFFRLLKVAPNKAQDEAIRTTAAIVDPLGPKQLRLFERLAVMENLSASVAQGQPLRFGFQSQEDVDAYRDRLRDVASRVPEVQKAIDSRKKIVRETVEQLVEYELLPEEAIENVEAYYHQQVHFYMLAHGLKSGGRRVGKKKRSFQKSRVLGEELAGEEMDYNTSYIEAESSWLTDALMEIEKERLFRELMERRDILPKLREQAKEQDVTWGSLVDDSHDVFQPEPGNVFYRAFTLPERIVEKLQQDVIETAELTKEDLRSVLVLARPKAQYVVPTELANQLRASQKVDAPHGLAAFSDGLMRAWKVYTLLNPKRALAYNLRNMTGDIDPVVASDPSLMRHSQRALTELWDYHNGTLQLPEGLRAARDLGVVDSGFVAEEVPDISELPVFRRFMGEAGKRKHPLNPVRDYFDTVKKYSQFRENVMRYCAFLGYREQLRQGRVKNYGGSNKAVVNALKQEMGVDVAAAHLARNLIGDYGNITVAGDWIRRRLLPFWSFQEINLKRVPRLAVNAWESGGTMRTAGVLSASAGRAILMSRIAWMYGALWVWNHLIQGGDEEEELTGEDRATPHVILGRNPDGSVRTFRRVGAMGDFLEWFGINEAISMWPKYQSGQVDLSDVLWEMAFATPEKLMNSMRPDLKALYEVPTGTSLFPEPFQPRSVRRGEAVSSIFGLQDEYQWLKGWALKDGSTARPHYWQRWGIGVVDPRQSALSQAYDLRNDFLKKKGKEQTGTFPVSRYKEARDAAQFEDYGAFTNWKRAYVEERGAKAQDDFRDWLGTIDPIASRLNDADELEFETEFLTSEQRDRLKVARNYSHEVRDLLVSWWDADEQSSEMKNAVASSAIERLDVSEPERKDYETDEKFREALSKYTVGNERALGDIKSMASTYEEAIQLLDDYYKIPTKKEKLRIAAGTLKEGLLTGDEKPGYNAKKAKLAELYGK